MKELLTPGGEHHEIGDGEGLVMTKNKDPPSPEPQMDSRSGLPMRTGGDGGSVSWIAIILSP